MVSINPLSWTTIGVGFGWLPLHAAMASTGLTSAHRRLLVAIGVLLFALAVGSHRSAVGFSVAVLLITTTHLLWLKIPHRRGLLFGATTSLGGILLLMLEWLPPRVLHALWQTPSRVESATPSGGEFENYYYLRDLLPVVPNAARSLFGFPGWNPSNPLLLTVALPEVVTFGCIGLFGYLLVQTYNSRQKLQMFGAGAVLVIASLVLFAQVASQTDKQYATSDVLVIYPLLIFLSVWWFFHAPEGLSEKLKSSLRSASKIATVLFSLSIFTVAERFVDRQSFGLRYLPEGRDQWWWTWLPVGPNVVVVLAPFFLWRFLSAYLAMLSSDQRALADR